MSDIRVVVPQLSSQEKEIGLILIEFYETMKSLEKDPERGGKQATKIVMTLGDIMDVVNTQITQKNFL